jgi:hypothetical protein
MKTAMLLMLLAFLAGCSSPRAIDHFYRADCSCLYPDADWPATNHPSLYVAHCGLTEFSYVTPEGIFVGVETVVPDTVLDFTLAPSNDYHNPVIRAQIGLEGTNVIIHIEHGTNMWTLKAGEMEKSNKAIHRPK